MWNKNSRACLQVAFILPGDATSELYVEAIDITKTSRNLT